MRVVVTGGAGNLGREVVRLLQERGDTPVVFDRVRFPGASVPSETGDITDRELLATVMKRERADGVIHLASMLQFACEADPAGATRINVDGTVSTLEAACRSGARRFVFASSVAVYGAVSGPIDERTPLDESISVYGATKLLAERLLRRYAALYGIASCTLRIATVLSPHPVSSRSVGTVVADILGSASGRDVTIPDVDGEDLRHFVYSKDAARAIVLAFTAKGCHDDLFNISGPTDAYLSFRELGEVVRRIRPQAGRVVFTGRSGHRGRVDGSRAASQLGYRPEYTIERAMREMLEPNRAGGVAQQG